MRAHNDTRQYLSQPPARRDPFGLCHRISAIRSCAYDHYIRPAIQRAKAVARKAGRNLAVVGFVCGTETDPQVLSAQEATLRAAGMVLAGNSANAAWLAGEWVR